MTTLLPTPEAIIQLVKCKCAKQQCSNNLCQCQTAGLPCTVFCSCSDEDECENQQGEDDSDDSDVVDGEIDN